MWALKSTDQGDFVKMFLCSKPAEESKPGYMLLFPYKLTIVKLTVYRFLFLPGYELLFLEPCRPRLLGLISD